MRTGTSPRTLFVVFLFLQILLLLTASASFLQPRWLGNSISISIAVAKAALVVWFFMQLRYHSFRIRIFALGALFWVSILFIITLTDYFTRSTIGIWGK